MKVLVLETQSLGRGDGGTRRRTRRRFAGMREVLGKDGFTLQLVRVPAGLVRGTTT